MISSRDQGGAGAVAPGEDASGTLLDTRSVVGYLVRRGLLPAGLAPSDVKVEALGGGVSCIVLLVEAGDDRLVVKQPRRRLLVEDEWFAKPERALAEAAGLRLTHRITAEDVPVVLDVDPESCTLTMEAAPASWRPWKELLLKGLVDSSVGWHLGALLGAWQEAISPQCGEFEALEDLETFELLRIDPYHRNVATRHPELAEPIAAAIAALVDDRGRRCFVHGDFSPKNVLVGEERLWVIDFEVAHLGNPVFDLAFLTTHLMLKSLHRDASADSYRECAIKFLEGYEGASRTALMPAAANFGLQVGCLLVARVDGKSPAEYLTAPEREQAWRIGTRLLRDPVHPVSVWPRSTSSGAR